MFSEPNEASKYFSKATPCTAHYNNLICLLPRHEWKQSIPKQIFRIKPLCWNQRLPHIIKREPTLEPSWKLCHTTQAPSRLKAACNILRKVLEQGTALLRPYMSALPRQRYDADRFLMCPCMCSAPCFELAPEFLLVWPPRPQLLVMP